MKRRILAFLLFGSAGLAQSAEDGRAIYQRILQRLEPEFTAIQQETCLETLRRAYTGSTGNLLKADETRLEVGVVTGKDFFGPEGGSLKASDPRGYAQGGLSGSGELFAYLQRVLYGPATQVRYEGKVDLDGRPNYRFTYAVPLSADGKGFTIDTDRGRAEVAYSGELLFDTTTEQPRALTINGDKLPQILGLRSFRMWLSYDPIDPASTKRPSLLPRSNLMLTERFSGDFSISTNVWTHCRTYATRTAIRFEGDDAVASTGASAGSISIANPTGEVTMRLMAEVPLADLGLHSRVMWEVANNGKLGSSKITKGSPVESRVIRIERRGSEVELWFAIETIRLDESHSLRFTAHAKKVSSKQAGVALVPSPPAIPPKGIGAKDYAVLHLTKLAHTDLPGVVALVIPAQEASLKAGLTVAWENTPLIPVFTKTLDRQDLPSSEH